MPGSCFQAYTPTPAIQHSESTSQSRSKPLRQFIAVTPVAIIARATTSRTPPSLPLRRLNRAEQPNKLHIFVFGWTTKCTASTRRETVVGHGIRQRPHDQSALSFIDHDLVFVIK